MNAQYRIWASPSTRPGERLCYELFEAKSDADKYFAELIAGDTVLCDAGYSCYTVGYEELHNGDWTFLSQKLVTIRGE